MAVRKFWRRNNSGLIIGFATAVTVVLAFSIISAAVIALLPAPQAGTTSAIQQLSDVLAPVTAGAAFLGVLISIFSINTNIRLTRDTQQAARFQKASELISDDLQTAEVAGISLLQELVGEDYGQFGKPTMAVLKAFIAESVPKGLEGRLNASHAKHLFPRTRIGIIQAVRLINFLHSKDMKRVKRRSRRLGSQVPKGSMNGAPIPAKANEVVYSLYLARWNREALTIRDLDFREMVASFRSMRGGFITNCNVEGRVNRQVRLTGTNLKGTTFRLKQIDGSPITPWDKHIIRFDNCTFDAATKVNGFPMQEWLALAEVEPPEDLDTMARHRAVATAATREDDYPEEEDG